MRYGKLSFLLIFTIFVISCGGSKGISFIDQLKKDTKTRSVLIIINASKITAQSIEIAKKPFTYRKEELPEGLDCIALGFSEINRGRDINLSLVSYNKWENGDLICEINDYKNFDKSISGEFNTIFILDK